LQVVVVLCPASIELFTCLAGFASLPCALRVCAGTSAPAGLFFSSGQRLHDASRHEQAQAHSSRAWPGSAGVQPVRACPAPRHAHAHRIRTAFCVPHGMMGSTWRWLTLSRTLTAGLSLQLLRAIISARPLSSPADQ